MKILILTNYANGLYLFRKELVESFIKEGHQVVVSVPFDENCKKLFSQCIAQGNSCQEAARPCNNTQRSP